MDFGSVFDSFVTQMNNDSSVQNLGSFQSGSLQLPGMTSAGATEGSSSHNSFQSGDNFYVQASSLEQAKEWQQAHGGNIGSAETTYSQDPTQGSGGGSNGQGYYWTPGTGNAQSDMQSVYSNLPNDYGHNTSTFDKLIKGGVIAGCIAMAAVAGPEIL